MAFSDNFDLEKFSYPVYNEETKEWEGTADYMAGTEKQAKKGIDVSTFQGEIDWKKVKNAGIEFEIQKSAGAEVLVLSAERNQMGKLRVFIHLPASVTKGCQSPGVQIICRQHLPIGFDEQQRPLAGKSLRLENVLCRDGGGISLNPQAVSRPVSTLVGQTQFFPSGTQGKQLRQQRGIVIKIRKNLPAIRYGFCIIRPIRYDGQKPLPLLAVGTNIGKGTVQGKLIRYSCIQ